MVGLQTRVRCISGFAKSSNPWVQDKLCASMAMRIGYGDSGQSIVRLGSMDRSYQALSIHDSRQTMARQTMAMNVGKELCGRASRSMCSEIAG